MTFRFIRGRYRTKYAPKKASTAFTEMDVVDFSSGKIQPATSSTTLVAGFFGKSVVSTDSDYASSPLAPYHIPERGCILRASVGTGTPSASSVGTQYDLTDSTSVDVSATTNKLFTLERVLSSTVILVSVNPAKLYSV